MENKENKFKTLDKKTKFWYIFLSIITLGLFYLYIKSKIKKINQQEEDVLIKKNENIKLSFNVTALIEALGTIDNIKTCEANLSSVKVVVKNKKLINAEQIKKLGAKGLIISDQKVSIVLGDQSPLISDVINTKLKD